jgi:hypothetical protein
MRPTVFLRASALAAVVTGCAMPAMAQPAGCHPALPVIRSDGGLIFTAEAFAHASWRERASGGRLLDYGRQIWRGRIDTRTAYLTFDEIPATSGPNHAMDYKLAPLRVRPAWRSTGTRYDLGGRFIIRGGVLAGAWTVVNC